MTENDANPWQQYWGESYGPESKWQLLKPVFGELEREDKIGNLIIDVGSGASPVTQLLKAKPARKRICIDIAADNVGSLNDLRIRLDAEKVGQFGSLSFRKALLRVCAFLGINPKTEAKTERADTVVFSDLLNYVDFRKVLAGFGKYLKPGGRIIVFNLPNRGNGLLFSDKGLKDNRQLYAFLEEHRFEIEHKAFPKRPRNEKDESQELIVLVAGKSVETLDGDAESVQHQSIPGPGPLIT
jgi:SAM-dependent methyltransferase